MKEYTLMSHLSKVKFEINKLEDKIDKEIAKGNFKINKSRYADTLYNFKIKGFKITVREKEEGKFILMTYNNFSVNSVRHLSLKACQMLKRKVEELKEDEKNV